MVAAFAHQQNANRYLRPVSTVSFYLPSLRSYRRYRRGPHSYQSEECLIETHGLWPGTILGILESNFLFDRFLPRNSTKFFSYFFNLPPSFATLEFFFVAAPSTVLPAALIAGSSSGHFLAIIGSIITILQRDNRRETARYCVQLAIQRSDDEQKDEQGL